MMVNTSKATLMYQTSLYFHFKAPNSNADNVLLMFFEDWADQICDREVSYSVVGSDGGGKFWSNEIIRVDFVNKEDAIAMKLKGIPDEFKKYLTFTTE
jgi:hypothetical protein